MMKRVNTAVLVFILVLLFGCGKKAEPIDMPLNDAVKSIEIITTDGAKVDITENSQILTVMAALSTASPTRAESVNDQPMNIDAYGTISIHTASESTVVYYYDKDSKHYIEQPYRGIYELEDSLEAVLLQE